MNPYSENNTDLYCYNIKINKMKTFDKHKQNLKEVDNKIYSYNTHVATIVRDTQFEDGHILQHGWWSVTTQRHINYVANYYDINIVINNYDNDNYST